MKRLQVYYEIFLERIKEIEKYIDILETQKKFIYELGQKVELFDSDFFQGYIENIKSVSLSPVQYNAVIISLYGCYENYLDGLFDEYVSIVCKYSKGYEDIPKRMKDKHLKRVGDYLANEQRYKNYDISSKDVIKNFYNLLNQKGSVEFGLNKKLLLAHSGNMRFVQVIELLCELGISDARTNIINHYLIEEYLLVKGEITKEIYDRYCAEGADEKIFSPLEELVDLRNNIAHSWVTDRKQLSEIRDEIIVFMKIFAEVLLDVVTNSVLFYMYEQGLFTNLGNVLNVIDNHILCIRTGVDELKRGDMIYCVSPRRKFVLFIKNIQINGVNTEVVAQKDIDIGIEFDKKEGLKIKKSYKFFLISEY